MSLTEEETKELEKELMEVTPPIVEEPKPSEVVSPEVVVNTGMPPVVESPHTELEATPSEIKNIPSETPIIKEEILVPELNSVSDVASESPIEILTINNSGGANENLNPPIPSGINKMKDLWVRFMDKVTLRKKAKLEKVMLLVVKNKKITNDDVEKLLHVSDATATRYLKELVKKGYLRSVGVRAGTIYEVV